MRELKTKVNLILGIILVGVIVLSALISFFWTPVEPNDVSIVRRHLPPSSQHLFGTDRHGRDIFSRCLVASQVALLVGILSVAVGAFFGIALGCLAGYYGGWGDEVLMRVMDGLYAFPPLLLAIMVVAVMGPGITRTILAIGVVNIPVFARLTRAGFLSERKKEYVEAARAVGAKDKRIILVHILPNILPTLLVQLSISFAIAILAEAGLSYLGLGTQPPDASWGRMLKEARIYLATAPWSSIFPGLSIAIAVLGFNMLGDGLRDWLDPKMLK